MDNENSMEQAKSRILASALAHVPFDGWSDVTLRAALADSKMADAVGAGLFPRGGVDLAIAYHKQGDQRMLDALRAADMSALRFREKITHAVRLRLELADQEAVRKGTVLLGLPHHAPEGAALIWTTADAIWTALGDTSVDVNWYTKRATLSAVYASTVLFWLGDSSDQNVDTWAFLDRRIENVMQFEKLKANVRQNRFAQAVLAGPLKLLERVSAPDSDNALPGRIKI